MSFIPFAFVRKNPLTRIHFITLWISQFRGISSAQLKQYVTGFDIRIENTTHPKVENHCWFLGRSHKIHDSKVGACVCVENHPNQTVTPKRSTETGVRLNEDISERRICQIVYLLLQIDAFIWLFRLLKSVQAEKRKRENSTVNIQSIETCGQMYSKIGTSFGVLYFNCSVCNAYLCIV